MPTFKERYFALHLHSSPEPLKDFLRGVGSEPFRDFVDYRMKDLRASELQDSSLADFALGIELFGLQAGLETAMRISGTLKARILIDPDYWTGPSARNCADAFVEVLTIMGDEGDLPGFLNEGRTMTEEQQRGSLCLFSFAVDMFAALGSESKLIRANMGIRKGILG